MKLTFVPISLDQQSRYHAHFEKWGLAASDYSFINLWAWAAEYDLTWAFDDQLVWIRQTLPEEVYWAPVGDWNGIAWKDALDRLGLGSIRFKRIPEQRLIAWQQQPDLDLTVAETRGDWDYLYPVQDLITLKGNRYHKKKNLVNQFAKQYDSSYLTLGAPLIEKARDMQVDWCTWRDCESFEMLSAENRAIEKVLDHWRQLPGLTGGALAVDNRLVAYTLAEILPDKSIIVHFEKANPDFKGAYQAINQKFLEMEGQGCALVNREQDLGIEGLRQGKLSYHPVEFVKKYGVTIDV